MHTTSRRPAVRLWYKCSPAVTAAAEVETGHHGPAAPLKARFAAVMMAPEIVARTDGACSPLYSVLEFCHFWLWLQVLIVLRSEIKQRKSNGTIQEDLLVVSKCITTTLDSRGACVTAICTK
jgi:hypothetical protein